MIEVKLWLIDNRNKNSLYTNNRILYQYPRPNLSNSIFTFNKSINLKTIRID